MTKYYEKYVALYRKVMLETLSVAEEDAILEEMDTLWKQLTDKERNQTAESIVMRALQEGRKDRDEVADNIRGSSRASNISFK